MAISITLARVIKYGSLNLWRNRWLSITAVAVMTITLLVLSTLLIINQLSASSAQNLRDRVNVSLYFYEDVSVSQVSEVKAELDKMEEVKSIRFVSADEALENFKRDHANEPDIQASLKEFEKNPFPQSLIISAKELNMYPILYEKVQKSRLMPLIKKIDYENSRELIQRLEKITSGIRNLGVVLTLVFGFVAVLVMFNTLRLTIFSRREEIEIMRLVGASNSYIRGPFLIEGIFYGLAATVIASILLYPVLRTSGPAITRFFQFDASSAGYFSGGFWQIILIQMAAGVFLGVLSSIVATKRHLRA